MTGKGFERYDFGHYQDTIQKHHLEGLNKITKASSQTVYLRDTISSSFH